MPSVFCSQGHQNLQGSRFCHLCGERLVAVQGTQPGNVLGDRYRIIRELGQGGFGRTYLAEDLNRFKELCVLKEFAPQVRSSGALRKAEELFEREAGVLYRLRHPQIPQFRELFRADVGSGARLFLVQDYVEGENYRQILEGRRLRGLAFTEAEVVQLFRNLLPVLQYLHGLAVIHRDISPDNLILRATDRQPVLIDFGGVKQLAASVALQYAPQSQPVTRVGKVGYAPDEQLQQGQVSPQSDLYALAMTALVLLTGREADSLDIHDRSLDPKTLGIGIELGRILQRMLATRPGDRYQAAEQVLRALESLPNVPSPSAVSPASVSHAVTIPVAPAAPVVSSPPPLQPNPFPPVAPGAMPVPVGTVASGTATVAHSARTGSRSNPLLGAVFALLLMAGTALGVWTLRDVWLPFFIAPDTPEGSSGAGSNPDSSNLSPEEVSRKEALSTKRKSLGIDWAYLVRITDEAFFRQHPEMQGKTLSDNPEDADWRAKWDAIANDWLDRFDKSLSPEARRKLGSYSADDRAAWKAEINQLNVGTKALNDLTDARFFQLFPQQPRTELLDKPIGQVWQAIAADEVTALKNGTTLKKIQFTEDRYDDTVNETLNPGEGRVYTANLKKGQILRVSLNAPDKTTLLSIYVPTPNQQTPSLLEDSDQRTWSGELPQSGYYEIVVVSESDRPFSYRLDIAVDDVTPGN